MGIHFAALLAACLAGLTFAAAAQESPAGTVDRLAGTLKAIKDRGAVRIGYREASPPFSYVDDGQGPIGYSIDLCNAIVEDVMDEIGAPELRVEHVAVTPENRFALLQAGVIDLECGSSTSTLERRKLVAFSPIIFVTGTKLVVRKHSGVRALRDLRGKSVVVTRGTTNAEAVEALSRKQRLDITFIAASDHKEAFELLASGKADALASDEVLIHSMLTQARNRSQFRILEDFLSYEPYAIAFRKDDPQFGAVVERTFRRLAQSRELAWVYDRWFTRRLPSGVRLDLPMSAQLTESFRALGLPD